MSRWTFFDTLVIVLLIAAAVVWWLGREQPIRIIAQTWAQSTAQACPVCGGTRLISCERCGGRGRIEAGKACRACRGTGRLAYQLDSQQSTQQYPCPHCRGTGIQIQAGQFNDCPQCAGKGRVTCPQCKGTGQKTALIQRQTHTTRADYSLWERCLRLLGTEPATNSAPQRRRDGSVPLIRQYLWLMYPEQAPALEVNYGAIEPTDEGWQITARVRLRDAATNTEQMLRFKIQNRQVAGVETAGP